MSLSALIAALLLEQLKPLAERKYLQGWLTGYVAYFQHHFNSGEYHHGRTAWWLAVLPVLAGAVLLFRGLHYLHPLLAWAFNVLALYLSMGFRRDSQLFTAIQQALQSAKLVEAREFLSTLRGRKSDELNADEIVRLTVEAALMAVLHHLFGVVVWFVLFSLAGFGGAAGALFYCLGLAMSTHDELDVGESGEAAPDDFARKMCSRLTWLPNRLTAATFAVVGNFEDTVYCWRSQAANWQDSEEGILLASAAGASGVRLGLSVMQHGVRLDRPELGVGDKSGDAALYCTSRLVWRSAVFMLVMLFMLTLAGLLR